MIPYEELDRALARWKAKAQGAGGTVEAPPVEVEPSSSDVEIDAAPSEGTPVVVDEVGSVLDPVPSERTGELDVAELEGYED